jgi:hypothetical protein
VSAAALPREATRGGEEPRHHHLSPDIPEHDYEPVPGLPERLPEGETLLWQGRPRWRGLAVRGFGLKGFAAYFAGLAAVQIAWGVAASHPADGIVFGVAVLATMAALVIGGLALLGWLAARSALYTITTQRVVLRVGVALPMTINIPFAVIDSLARRDAHDGTEDLVIKIMRPARASWIALWPHVKGTSVLQPQPMLRALPVEAGAAQLLARALAAHAGAGVQPVAADTPKPAAAGAPLAA